MTLQENFDNSKKEATIKGMPVEDIISISFSGNLAVVKTFPGYASTVALAFDNYDFFEIMGSVAGDDTLLLVIKENIKRNL